MSEQRAAIEMNNKVDTPGDEVVKVGDFYGAALARPMSPTEIAPLPGEVTVRMRVPGRTVVEQGRTVVLPILITLDPRDSSLIEQLGSNRVLVPQGEYDMPARLADHWYLRRAGAIELWRSDGSTYQPPAHSSSRIADVVVDPQVAELRGMVEGMMSAQKALMEQIQAIVAQPAKAVSASPE